MSCEIVRGLGFFFLFFTPLWYFNFYASSFINSGIGAISTQQKSALGKTQQLLHTHKRISEKLFFIPKLVAARVHNSKPSFLMGKAHKTRLNKGEIS